MSLCVLYALYRVCLLHSHMISKLLIIFVSPRVVFLLVMSADTHKIFFPEIQVGFNCCQLLVLLVSSLQKFVM